MDGIGERIRHRESSDKVVTAAQATELIENGMTVAVVEAIGLTREGLEVLPEGMEEVRGRFVSPAIQAIGKHEGNRVLKRILFA